MLATSTGKDETYGSPDARYRFFSVTHDILGDPFWAVYRRGVAEAAERTGCQVRHVAPERFSPPEMARLLETAIASQPDGVLATVPDAAAVEGPLREALARGIPVIAVNAADPRPEDARIPYLRYVGADDAAGGRAVGARIVRDGGAPRRALAVDHYLVDNACHSERCAGFAVVLAEHGAETTRLRVPGDDPARAADLIAEHLEAHPELDAVCTLGPPGCAFAIDALERTGRLGTVRHGSFDLAPAQLDAIEAGRLTFTIDSQQYLQGYLGVTMLSLYVEHGLLPASDVLTGPSIVDAGNLETVRGAVAAGRR